MSRYKPKFREMLRDLLKKEYLNYQIICVDKHQKKYKKGFFKPKFIINLMELNWMKNVATTYVQIRLGLFSWSDLKDIDFDFEIAIDDEHNIVFCKF